ncbi:3-hydroxyisobutyrate dehydrogenase-like beta-hydroxyacid dehydrogenase [Streptomyces sp. PvR006]|uniref:NAD(P)-dependent oxidoreductase n=1 Tax=Streptomyces sp. PvR006 TaxID=2817860 RepID=UPI001AEAB838|nr:NAD(P)-binding domain-containing protein [Streptomyces sp. PvR006]MBP2583991.1 3-hydroxyisobutyrate dehydrogenase-like beta-hydroxyacid dehydrogenase [Streptomyces sp. PvR006]
MSAQNVHTPDSGTQHPDAPHADAQSIDAQNTDAQNTGAPGVTVIGLGQMGSALADAFLTAGHRTTVWNRTPGKADSLVARGAVRAASVAEAVEAGELVVVCVLDYPAVRGLLAPVAGSLRGRVLVNLTSGSPEQARAEAEWAAEQGAGYLDGAVMTTPPGVGDSANMFLYSGSPELLAAHRATLAVLGDPVDLGPDAGLASLYDAGLLGLMWSVFGGWLHATALTGADGVPARDFTAVATRWLKTVSWFMTTYAEQIDEGRYPGDDATIDVQVAAIGHLLHAGETRGVDNRLPELHLELMRAAVEAGHGGDSYARIIDNFRK